jgi:hypothetical protein
MRFYAWMCLTCPSISYVFLGSCVCNGPPNALRHVSRMVNRASDQQRINHATRQKSVGSKPNFASQMRGRDVLKSCWHKGNSWLGRVGASWEHVDAAALGVLNIIAYNVMMSLPRRYENAPIHTLINHAHSTYCDVCAFASFNDNMHIPPI